MTRHSVVIVTKNEEANLAACLESVAWADERIVVDSFSTDGTVAIAQARTPHVFIRAWKGYADQKNFGIDQAAGEWVLILDADERVSPELAREIQALAEQPRKEKVFRIPFKNHLGGFWLAHGGLYPDYHPRLFRKGSARYGAREIHETLDYEGPAGRLKHPILHFTYADIATYLHKVNHYTSLEAEHLHLQGFVVRWWHFLSPLSRFFKFYVRKRGFQDGFHGFASALLLSIYPVLVSLKVLELRHRGR
ncbi:MAG TPA: glycosyltransferase family 2 protein [Geothrix sp.]|jgi:glycosyltransferase involved in cell wall biosynthesis|nr:glycosyltransferase family 2 protein [Geothrix sp.]